MLSSVGSVAVAVIVSCAFSFLPAILLAGDSTHPFVPGEKLTFDLKWGSIGAGRAVLRVLPMKILNGSEVYHFEVTVKSSGSIDPIFKIRDRVESYADIMMTHSLLYKQKIREGGYRKERVVTFDWEKNEVEYISDNKKPRYISVMPGTFDPLAALYYLRLQPMEGNSKIERPITDGSNNVVGRVNILRREKVTVRNRTYDAYVLEPIMDEVELFSENKDSSIRIWVTADKRRLLVLIKSKVTFGYFKAELRKIEHYPPARSAGEK